MKKSELVFIPNPCMGHLISTIELAKILLHHHSDLYVVVLILNHHVDHSVNTYIESLSCDSDHSHLTFLTLPPLSDRRPDSSFLFNIDLHKPLVKQVVEDRMRSGSPKPVGFVLDMFFTSIMDVADELDIPSYFFFTSGATFLNLMFHFQSLAHDIGVDIITEFDNSDVEFDLPGFRNLVSGNVLPRVFFDEVFGHKMILNNARIYRRSKGILVNTFMEMQSDMIKVLIDKHDKNNIPPVYPVGPILGLENKSHGGSESKKKDEESIMEWLNEQPNSSVVFLCFGSMGSFDEAQIKEIANGLDRAGYRFLWSLQCQIKREILENALPTGFINRKSNRGKIIGWAPQVSILAHRALGGFVSHCGWNSTLESIWFGVPMATWPLFAEQQLNAFELVKELGIAVEIKMDYEQNWLTRESNMLVTSDEIENGVKKLMCMDEKMKEKVRKMSQLGKKALEQNGSSYNWLGRFVVDVFDNSVA